MAWPGFTPDMFPPPRPRASSVGSNFDSDDSDSPLFLPRPLRPPSPASVLAAASAFLSSPPPDAARLFLSLLAFRLLNALTIRTFFQPDEYFQSLEPAWATAFGHHQAPWITWEWRHQLRSSLHPLFFTAVYSLASWLAQLLRLPPVWRADLLIAAPKAAQAVIAAVGDLYTWRLACGVYGNASHAAWAALAVSILSPWQWFCSTRTLSNCLETTLTVVALYHWPWEWSVADEEWEFPQPRLVHALRGRAKRDMERYIARHTQPDVTAEQFHAAVLARYRRCVPLAALACLLRPTNILIWIPMAWVAFYPATPQRRMVLLREALVGGSVVLAVSLLADRYFYGFWTFPPFHFLYFNVVQSLSLFYGSNDIHYYVSQGFPLLLTTVLPFAVVAWYKSFFGLYWQTEPPANRLRAPVRFQLAVACLLMPLVLSVISHKEVRFIYPLLPALHVLLGPTLVAFVRPALLGTGEFHIPKRLVLIFLLLVNAVMAVYTTTYHASGPMAVLSYLREQRQAHGSPDLNDITQPGITAGFLMPCHSTPWRSHLVYPTIGAWALSCEPPVGLDDHEKATYLDEADQFYAHPGDFLRTHMAGGLRNFRRRPSYHENPPAHIFPARYQTQTPHDWPDYLIFFAQMEPTLRSQLRFSAYDECFRTWNSHWHDDWRRQGDIVVWCVDPDEQAAWQAQRWDRQRAERRQVQQPRDTHFDRIIQTIKVHATGSKPAPSRWTALFSRPNWSRSRSESWSGSWSWPWQRRQRPTFLGYELPEWMVRSKRREEDSWALPSREEWNRRLNDRRNWA
ncbi:hypothetical protein BO70DRAFT_395097 [Aspergillus heteromorphus CBS 117.55]|uniref:Mannosyltransferase n=1 Tax=Aspergillus heteromorphus CBS 117.55 TaxID=1448321 RepID=A0A317WLN5_9EURO|nr:uncharacterized protein BO70DRAFT_395097 [Aspergillus heteromorphus CBS 117.55]PWY85967.1 hypothetical protein BO70DRAFT_395097 [Aspergillus heteromorphus CBS 117.55]